MSVTVAQVVLMAKQKADMVNSNFVIPNEWISYCDRSWKELYDILISKFEDYYTAAPLVLQLVSGNTLPLPANFYKMRGMDRQISGTEYYTIRPFTFEDRNNRRRQALYRGLYPTVRYRILGNNLIFTPDDGGATGFYRMWFIPRAADLTVDTDTIDGVNGWEEYVAVDMAIKALQKEESDVTVLMQQKMALKQRIEDLAQNRDAGETDRVTDITMSGDDNPFFYPGGW